MIITALPKRDKTLKCSFNFVLIFPISFLSQILLPHLFFCGEMCVWGKEYITRTQKIQYSRILK